MKAFVRKSASNQEVGLQEVPLPLIKDDEVLVEIKAFGVGIHDRYFIPGNIGSTKKPDFPYVIGSEGSGIITQLGNKIKNFHVGDRVIATTVLQEQGGTWAEYAAVKQSALVALPDALSCEQGAALPVAGKTALESLRALNLSQGDTLFVAGASGAVGTLVIQLAKAKGAKVVSSASAKNQDYMRSLGADFTVDYEDDTWKDQVKTWSGNGVDIALAIQPGTVQDSMDVVKDSGKVITVSGTDDVLATRNITIKQFQHGIDTNQAMKQLIADIAHNTIKLIIEQVYRFDQALVALEKTETRHARGKSVVKT